MNKRYLSILLCVSVSGGALLAQNSVLTVSGGAGMGLLSEEFRQGGQDTKLRYLAPGGFIDADIAWGNFYIDMACAVLFAPVSVKLGSATVDTSGYILDMGADFTALGIGYMLPLFAGLSAGGAVGFHVSAPTMSPPDGDITSLRLEGYYGLIGLSLTPRLRFALGDSFVVTCSVPIGIDFGAMSEDVVVGGVDTGADSSAIVNPAGLDPLFRGFTAGLYLSAGLRIPLAR